MPLYILVSSTLTVKTTSNLFQFQEKIGKIVLNAKGAI